MILIKIDETKTRNADLPLSIPGSCFKCPFYYTQSCDEGCINVGWCGLNDGLGYSETNVFNDDIIDGDDNLVDDIIRPDECPLIDITKEDA